MLKTYKCIKKFEAEMNDENHVKEINDDVIVELGSVWFHLEHDDDFLEAVVHGNHYRLEVDEEILSEHFVEIVN